MKIFKLIIVVFILFVKINASEKVSLQLDWLHQFQFAGYYMAKEKGFYKEKNLEVEIKEYKQGLNLTKEVLDLKSNFAVGKSSLIIDALEGKSVALLSAIYQTSPMVLISLDKPDIKSLDDLKGKKVSMTSDARIMASINSMLISKKLTSNDINFIEHSFNIEDLIDGKTDAMACYLSNEPYILKKEGVKYKVFNPSDYGFDFYGGILFTSQKEIENNPLRVKKFNESSLKGWRYAFEHIEETARIIFTKYNSQNKSLDSLIYEGKVLKKLAGYDKNLLGSIDISKIKELERLYLLLSLDIKLKKSSENLVYNPSSVTLTNKEKEYLRKNKISLLSNKNFPPMTFIDDDGKLTGLELDYWALINKKLNNSNYEIRDMQNNEEGIDIIKKEDKNALKYSFSIFDDENISKSNVIFRIPFALVTKRDKPFISDISTLDAQKVAIWKGSSFYPILKKRYPNLELVFVNTTEELILKLMNNEVFGIVEKLPRISYLIHKESYPNLQISGTFKEKYELRLSINKTNKILQNIINKAISSIDQEDRKKIDSKYYYIVYQTSVDYSWIYKILLPLVFILIIIIVTNRKLNKEINRRKEIEERLQRIASIDALTNIYNRRRIEEIFEKELIRTIRYNRNFSIIFFDIDDFKHINDSLGHKIGDNVLIELTKLVKDNLRKTDLFGRWGGEEFLILLPETDKEQAKCVSSLLRDKISKHDFNINKPITCSFGVSQFVEDDTASSLLSRADDAMYYVKRNGKNGVRIN